LENQKQYCTEIKQQKRRRTKGQQTVSKIQQPDQSIENCTINKEITINVESHKENNGGTWRWLNANGMWKNMWRQGKSLGREWKVLRVWVRLLKKYSMCIFN
jgi:hypothetical protein